MPRPMVTYQCIKCDGRGGEARQCIKWDDRRANTNLCKDMCGMEVEWGSNFNSCLSHT